MIYFVRSQLTGHIKIGYTADMKRRMLNIKYKCGEIDVLGIVKGTVKDEGKLHKQFEHLHINDSQYGTEWFSAEQELIEYIHQFTIPYSSILEVEYQDITPKLTPLEITLGTSRAQILIALQSPLNTGELANKLTLSAGAVSQHLKNLQQAGLIKSTRNGKNVYHRLTRRSRRLLALF